MIATFDDRLSRFLTAGDLDGDGKRELVAATFSSGVWLLRPGSDPKGALEERAGRRRLGRLRARRADHGSRRRRRLGELYVASDKHKELRRYTWQ